LGGGACLLFGWNCFLVQGGDMQSFRESAEGQGKTRTSPTWEGRIISGFLGLTGMGVGIFIIFRILAGRQ
jgi:hypothetical protein